jgi:hypothetical protein
MARPTMMQHYYLGLFRVARAFGLVFAVGSVLIAIGNLPDLLRAGDAEEWAVTLMAAIGFSAIGALLFIVSGRAQKQYRAYINAQTD